ncbi:kinase-like domain-containing protein [Rhizophagus irregularis DAOM 181602=DAOM 197198]|nr:kinase-like domain-containing protein [Rhizophagus irregularis DAOM 181602=DAOM 197198]
MVKSLVQCYSPYITKIHGVTRDPETKDYMLIMEYANGGNLHNYLQKNFMNISWSEKLYILWKITEG